MFSDIFGFTCLRDVSARSSDRSPRGKDEGEVQELLLTVWERADLTHSDSRVVADEP